MNPHSRAGSVPLSAAAASADVLTTFLGGIAQGFSNRFGWLATSEGRGAFVSNQLALTADVMLQLSGGIGVDPGVSWRNGQRAWGMAIGMAELVPAAGMGAGNVIDGLSTGNYGQVGEGTFDTTMVAVELLALRGAGRAAPLTRAEAAVEVAEATTARQILLNRVSETRTLSEAKGVVYGTREMERLGYKLEDVSLSYGSGNGVDLAFSKGAGYAILEAKHASGLSRLATDVGGLRQGSNAYNISRLERYLDLGGGANDAFANTLLREARSGNLESFTSSYRAGKTYELPLGWPNPAFPAIKR